MVSSIMNWIKQSLLCGLDIFDKFISSDSNILKVFMSFFVIFVVYRFLIAPEAPVIEVITVPIQVITVPKAIVTASIIF